ncbi:GNAT family N-acetyltransferase [Calycomorphotria hydatis]|uniref:Ribosomal N-acetyltransferase YdaF n=1 Tax=Calycomorphotria hydatis TaxID=2528027 RepID=A0A517T3S7_9PLAN|nr:GNAT family N-acetyltransferase [Calycomorphotria hydatis]QDT63033.1 Putative ribosomal N-acetyltransferase YdaF [Calycomorphotria hydatis]
MELPPTITTGRLLLRPPQPGDAPAIHRLASDRDVASTTARIPHPYEPGMAEEWIQETATQVDQGKAASFVITQAVDQSLVGTIGLTINAEHERAELGYWIGKPYWGKGYATEAARAVIGYGFQTLRLYRIHAHHMTTNPASGRVLEKCGMTHEGKLRQFFKKWDVIYDIELWAVLQSEFEATADSSGN